MRFELNPAKLGKGGLDFFRERLADFLLVEADWSDISAGAKITWIDLASDIINLGMERLHFHVSSTGKTHAYFGLKGATETVYLGLKKGKSGKVTIYNKRQQLKDTKRLAKYDGLPHTRVEIRARTALSIDNLGKLSNPFDKLDIGYLPHKAENMPAHVWQHFCDSVRYRGITEALNIVPSERLPIYKAALDQGEPIWRPLEIWKSWPGSLDGAGLVTSPA